MSDDVFSGSLTREVSEPASLSYAKAMPVQAAAGAAPGLAWGAALAAGWLCLRWNSESALTLHGRVHSEGCCYPPPLCALYWASLLLLRTLRLESRDGGPRYRPYCWFWGQQSPPTILSLRSSRPAWVVAR